MKKYPLYHVLRNIIAPIFLWYYQPEIIGKEKIRNEGSVLLVGNHIHAFDPLLVDCCTKRCVHALAKSELFFFPLKIILNRVGTVSVDLDAKHNPEALKQAIQFLKEEEVVNVSPEAERNYTDEVLLPFKKGACIMSQTTNTKILPYAIIGEYRFHSKNLKIIFGEEVEFFDQPIDEANQKLHQIVKELIVENQS